MEDLRNKHCGCRGESSIKKAVREDSFGEMDRGEWFKGGRVGSWWIWSVVYFFFGGYRPRGGWKLLGGGGRRSIRIRNVCFHRSNYRVESVKGRVVTSSTLNPARGVAPPDGFALRLGKCS
jgi:hypothetical protein